MPPPFRAATALLALAVTCAGVLRAQRPHDAIVMVRDANGDPVAGAVGVLITDPAPDLIALRGVRRHADLLDAEPSRATGMLRWSFPSGASGGGAWITSPDGRAALLARVGPGSAQRVILRPPGILRPDTGARCTLFATALLGERRIPLPPSEGTSFPLPAGDYEVWTVTGDRAAWQRVALRSGARVTLGLEGPSHELLRGGQALVTPAGRPDLELLDDERERVTLCGNARLAPLLASLPSGRLVAGIPGLASLPDGTRRWPDPDALEPWRTIEVDTTPTRRTALSTIEAFVVQNRSADDWVVLSRVEANAGERLRLPSPRSGDQWLVVLARGFAPFSLPLTPSTVRLELPGDRGADLIVACRLEGGSPQPGVIIEYEPANGKAALVRARSDRRGLVSFGPVRLPGTVRTSDPHYLNDSWPVETGAPRTVTVEIRRGAALLGVVRRPDGDAAGGATVTLRDPRGTLRPRSRTTLSSDDGSFRFDGLPLEESFILFATVHRDGRTWSSPLVRAAAGADPVSLVIRDDDPRLPNASGDFVRKR